MPFALAVAIESGSGCDIAGAPFAILDETGATVTAGELPPVTRLTTDSEQYDPRHGSVDLRPSVEIMVPAPASVGSFAWTLALPSNAIDGIWHNAASLGFRFATREHLTSLAVWDNPTPLAVGSSHDIKVGAKCSAGCPLAGETVEVIDAEGAVVGRAQLGATPWPGTASLYWTSLLLRAPDQEGHYRWSARMAGPALGLPHGTPVPTAFSFVVTKRAEHQVAISVVDADSGAPVGNAQIRLGPFRAATNRAGLATIALPPGDFNLKVFKDNYEVRDQALAVSDDVNVVVAAQAIPEEDPYARYWKT
ncbi:MAG: carboxypeptidase regulatory-like domain-containing protein [Bauldia sp.]|nr:carboxypeptidase regulatory-like domain-containing protein [Bauldia sp.]